MADLTGRVVIIGSGGHAGVLADALGADVIAGYLAPEDGRARRLGEWLGADDCSAELAAAGARFAVGIGFVDHPGAQRRARILAGYHHSGVDLAVVHHPSATVSASAVLEPGVFVAAGAIVGPGARLGVATIVNSGAVVDHDCVLGDNVHIAPGVTLSGSVQIGANTLIGVGATVLQGVQIGSGAVVGAGAVVLSDVASGATVVGVPARVVEQ